MGDNLGARLVIMSKDGVRTSASAVSEIHFPRVSPDGSKAAYEDDGSIYVLDVATGKSDEVAYGRMAAWVDDDTLLVAPE
jgi:Tol biopolymer transport system component